MLVCKASILAGLNRAGYEAGLEGVDPEVSSGDGGRVVLMSGLEGCANRTITNLLATGEADRLDWGLLLVTYCDAYLDGVIDRLHSLHADESIEVNLGTPLWPTLVMLQRIQPLEHRWRAQGALKGTLTAHATSPYLAVGALSEKMEAVNRAA